MCIIEAPWRHQQGWFHELGHVYIVHSNYTEKLRLFQICVNFELMYVSEFYKKIFGCKVYKISLDAGCTCPTRDGTKGNRGCIFCNQSGSGDFAASRNKSISEQIEDAKKLVAGKMKNPERKFIAYFQNFTNTYGDPKRLSSLYNEAVSSKDVCGISIATRPDCLNEEILQSIKSLCDKTFVQIEFGLQTANEKSAEFIRRGFPLKPSLEAVKQVRNTDSRIHIVTHVIFGLPEEKSEDMMNTVRLVCETSDGIKISCLHILRGTDLFELYENGYVKILEEEEYYDLLGKALEIIPKDFVIHRLTGDGAKKILAAPLWTANKRKVHNEIASRFGVF